MNMRAYNMRITTPNTNDNDIITTINTNDDDIITTIKRAYSRIKRAYSNQSS